MEGLAGCKSWEGTDALWNQGTVPATAKNSCAQPGKAVAAHPEGAWCICGNQTERQLSPGLAGRSTFNIASAKTDGERGKVLLAAVMCSLIRANAQMRQSIRSMPTSHHCIVDVCYRNYPLLDVDFCFNALHTRALIK